MNYCVYINYLFNIVVINSCHQHILIILMCENINLGPPLLALLYQLLYIHELFIGYKHCRIMS